VERIQIIGNHLHYFLKENDSLEKDECLKQDNNFSKGRELENDECFWHENSLQSSNVFKAVKNMKFTFKRNRKILKREATSKIT
jgi:hypothetical protein